MIKHRTLARGIGSSCFGILALASAAVYAQDGLADYHEDLSMYGSPRPAAAGGVSPSRVPEQVADIEEVSLDRRVVSRMIHDHRWQPVDPLGDYMEDFSGGVFEGGQIAGDKALFHIYLADQGERVPIVLGQDPHHGVEVIITIRGDAGLGRKIRRYITSRGDDGWHAFRMSLSENTDVR